MLRAIKVRLYPNNEQDKLINQLLGAYRFVSNKCQEYNDINKDNDDYSLNESTFSHYFHNVLRKNPDYEWLTDKHYNTKVIKQGINDKYQSFNRFFNKLSDYPKYKSRKSKQSMRFPIEAISNKTFNEVKSHLNLTKYLKNIKFECSDRNKLYLFTYKYKLKSITISKTKTNHYYASILIDSNEPPKSMNKPKNEYIALDLGIKSFITTSVGEFIDNPKFLRSVEHKLKKLHKSYSHKQKGSNNQEKARLKLAKYHQNITNSKLHYIHNITSNIISDNQVIIIEDLNVAGIVKNHCLAKAILELSLYELKRQLIYKAQWYGRTIIIVDRYYPSSKLCSNCGNKHNNLKISDRIYHCTNCDINIDRDYNAALNLLNEGKRLYKNNRDTLSRINACGQSSNGE